MQMGKEQKNFLLPDEHIYHPLMRNSITVNAISLLVIFGLQAGFAVYYIIVFRKSPYQNASIGFTIGSSSGLACLVCISSCSGNYASSPHRRASSFMASAIASTPPGL